MLLVLYILSTLVKHFLDLYFHVFFKSWLMWINPFYATKISSSFLTYYLKSPSGTTTILMIASVTSFCSMNKIKYVVARGAWAHTLSQNVCSHMLVCSLLFFVDILKQDFHVIYIRFYLLKICILLVCVAPRLPPWTWMLTLLFI